MNGGIAVVLLGALFAGIYYYMNSSKDDKQQDKQVTGTRLEQLVHKYRMQAPSTDDIMEMRLECERRGLSTSHIPDVLTNKDKKAEIAAKLQMLLEQSQYVHYKELDNIGEDKIIPKTTLTTDLLASNDVVKTDSITNTVDEFVEYDKFKPVPLTGQIEKPKETKVKKRRRLIKRRRKLDT